MLLLNCALLPVWAAGFPELGIGFTGVSLAFGLTVLTMAYAVGGISGGHFNPASKKHGMEAKEGAHAGDMPNLYVPANGELTVDGHRVMSEAAD